MNSTVNERAHIKEFKQQGFKILQQGFKILQYNEVFWKAQTKIAFPGDKQNCTVILQSHDIYIFQLIAWMKTMWELQGDLRDIVNPKPQPDSPQGCTVALTVVLEDEKNAGNNLEQLSWHNCRWGQVAWALYFEGAGVAHGQYQRRVLQDENPQGNVLQLCWVGCHRGRTHLSVVTLQQRR